MSILNKHIVNSGGKGANRLSETFHALRRTTEGALFYQLKDRNVESFNNGQGILTNDNDYVSVVEEFITANDENYSGNGSQTDFTLSINYGTGMSDRLAVYVDATRLIANTDYTVSNTTLSFTVAPHNGAYILVRRIKKEYYNNFEDPLEFQFTLEDGSGSIQLETTSNTEFLINEDFSDLNDIFQQYRFENRKAYYKIDSDGKLVKIENKRVTLTEIVDNFSTFENAYPVNSTTYST